MRLLLFLTTISTIYSLTCYNGGRLLRTSAVGESVEECPSSSYCYNMTANVAFIVDAVKAGCSTWRCMLARDTCITTTFQLIPVSLCCCSQDRCNVAGNPAYNSITGGNAGGFGGNGGDSGSIGGNAVGGDNGGATQDGYGAGNSNYNGWGNNNNEEQTEAPKKGWFGGLFGKPDEGQEACRGLYIVDCEGPADCKSAPARMCKNTPAGSLPGSASGGGKWDPKEIENKFKSFDIDHRGEDTGEEVFEKVDVRHTTRPPRRMLSHGRGTPGKEVELRV